VGWLRRILALFFGAPPRSTARPTQSSFHLVWQVDPEPAIVAAEVTLVVDADPVVDDLYFWALQASFSDAARSFGGGHTGLQWNARFPGFRAVNWGGYHDQRFGGAVLDGTDSPLPSARNDRNTRDYDWRPGAPYRFRIERGSRAGFWAAEVTEVATGQRRIIRELECRGDRLTGLVMWSEVFAACDAPSVSVRWSELVIERGDGRREPVDTVETRYQAVTAGGCSNTDSSVQGAAFVQTTNTERISSAGTRLKIG
jgi:hypothetical protein